MKAFLVGLALFAFTSHSLAEVCEKHSPNAKFICARAGDEFATMGNFAEAKKAWSISCEEGLSSACDAITSMNRDISKFKAEWSSDPLNQAERRQNWDSLECKTKKALKNQCLAKARNLEANHDTVKAISIYRGLCDSNVSEACYELGGIEVRSRRPTSAIQPYMNACSLGHAIACSALSSVQAEIKSNADHELLLEQKQKELAAKAKADKIQTLKTAMVVTGILSGKPSPKLRCKSKKAANGETETECFENTPIEDAL